MLSAGGGRRQRQAAAAGGGGRRRCRRLTQRVKGLGYGAMLLHAGFSARLRAWGRTLKPSEHALDFPAPVQRLAAIDVHATAHCRTGERRRAIESEHDGGTAGTRDAG